MFEIYIKFIMILNTILNIYILKDFIYLFVRDTHREKQRQRQREKQAPCREPDLGLDPGPPGSRPGLQVELNR